MKLGTWILEFGSRNMELGSSMLDCETWSLKLDASYWKQGARCLTSIFVFVLKTNEKISLQNNKLLKQVDSIYEKYKLTAI